MATTITIIVFGFMEQTSEGWSAPRSYFRPGEAGDFNFYGYSEENGCPGHAGDLVKLGSLLVSGEYDFTTHPLTTHTHE
jgi:hypothetical protein